MELKNKKMDSKLFKTIQDEVLLGWSSGNEVDFEEADEIGRAHV